MTISTRRNLAGLALVLVVSGIISSIIYLNVFAARGPRFTAYDAQAMEQRIMSVIAMSVAGCDQERKALADDVASIKRALQQHMEAR